MNQDQESDYGSELDYTDSTLLDRLDALPTRVVDRVDQFIQQPITTLEELSGLDSQRAEVILDELQPMEVEEVADKRSLWLVPSPTRSNWVKGYDWRRGRYTGKDTENVEDGVHWASQTSLAQLGAK